MWQIEFTSAKFCPYLPEDSQANPGVYGFELAHWLSLELMKRGVVTGYPLGEDWGWFIERIEGETELMICCSSQADEGEGYKGLPIQWSIFIRAPGGLFRKRAGPAAERATATLSQHILAALQSAGIEVRPA
ncbi:hypothetical protein D0B54_23410 [Solimonas sp. K1W22B-7]|uniref:hypothetical protein n=1 Tax=Solimonas sp. K1W22B-7 TaxID=2303331 RepID=UPI000E3336F6|nr:hypothetical protein [Solimonas sp. K1W22B-7]AXQ31450.1 hypothetical protein D0B54_23410 [Solimonas sp. K1W22B-7]